ncbi:hypothetical protein GCM10008949_45030 [Deinococcus humi]|nr:hypothetical protein GCM10008949_45030 [Deinococcus humi]
MTKPRPADLQRTELTRHFKACAPFLRHDTLQCVVDIVFVMVTARDYPEIGHGGVGIRLTR